MFTQRNCFIKIILGWIISWCGIKIPGQWVVEWKNGLLSTRIALDPELLFLDEPTAGLIRLVLVLNLIVDLRDT